MEKDQGQDKLKVSTTLVVRLSYSQGFPRQFVTQRLYPMLQDLHDTRPSSNVITFGTSRRLTCDVSGVLQHINEKWGIITEKDCVPVHIALQLMDYSSLGRGNDYDDFKQTSKALQKGLKAIVNGMLLKPHHLDTSDAFLQSTIRVSTVQSAPSIRSNLVSRHLKRVSGHSKLP